MPYLLILKKKIKILNCCLLQIIGGALRVKLNNCFQTLRCYTYWHFNIYERDAFCAQLTKLIACSQFSSVFAVMGSLFYS